MNGVAEGIHDGGDFGTDAGFVDGPEVFGRDLHVFGEDAVDTDAEDGFIETNIAFAEAALVALAAGNVRVAGDEAADGDFGFVLGVGVGIEGFDHGAGFDNFADEFVTEDTLGLVLAF